MTQEEADERIRLSVRRLLEWRWLSTLSTKPDEVLCQLREEAKVLIKLGTEHPRKTSDIGKVVVAYYRFMDSVKKMMDDRVQ